MSWKKKLALGFLALFALVFLFLVIEHLRGKWGVSRWKTRMRARGEPVTVAAVPSPPPPVEQNGMPALIAAAGQMGSLPVGFRPPASMYAASNKMIAITKAPFWSDRSGRTATNVTWQMLGEELVRYQEPLRQAIQALDYTKFRMRLNYDEGWSMRLPHLMQLRRLAYVMSAALLYDFQQSKFDEGTEKLEAAIRLPNALEDEPIGISQLIRMGHAYLAFACTWQATQSEGIADQHLKRLQTAWAEQDFLRQTRRAFSMEHAVASHEFDRFRAGDADIGDWIDNVGPPPKPINSPADLLDGIIERTPEMLQRGIYVPIWLFAWSHQDELQYLETVERGLNLWDEAIRRQSAVPLKAIGNREYEPLVDRQDSSTRNAYDRMRYILSPRADGFYPSMMLALKTQTLRELALAGLALRRYQLHVGKPPQHLQELVPEFLPGLPQDFMSGQPLKYAVSTNGTVLYSVGTDGEDNGGEIGPNVPRSFLMFAGKDFVWPQEASPEEATSRFKNER